MSEELRAAWPRIEALLDEALSQPAGERLSWLETQPDPPAIRAEVAALLRASDRSDGFLEAPEDTEGLASGPGLLQPGERLGAWAVIGLLGRGGMGEVYEVHRADGRYEQRAALKLLARLDTAEDRRRFDAERRWLAELNHPGIARLLDGGEWDGRPYAVMEYVDGEPITRALEPMPLTARVRSFLQVCEAVSHAHQHFIVHRDLKPSNVLVDRTGHVKLLDFGIAKSLSPGVTGELTQTLRLSPDYCAPEQLDGGRISTATDVYALGVLLYELLCGQRPFQLTGQSLARWLDRLGAERPVPPSERVTPGLRRRIRGDLDAIVLKALRPEPEARYPVVPALMADLRAWLEGRPVSARGDGVGYVLRRTLVRQRRWVAAGLMVFAALAAGLVGTTWQAREAARERDLAQREARRSEAVRESLMMMFRSAGELPSGAEMSAREILDRAAGRVEREFADAPETLAGVLQALAELYIFLNHDAGAEPLLLTLLDLEGRADPAVIAMAKHDLALVYARRNQVEPAAALLAEAQYYWRQDPERYFEPLLESRLVEARLLRDLGDVAAAIEVLETALADRLRHSGPQHRNVGVLRNNLGVQLVYAGRSAEAIPHFRDALALWQRKGLEQTEDALVTLANWATAEMQQGDHAAAAPLFERAIGLRRALYGPSGAMAALLNNHGKSLIQLGQADRAVPLLTEALPYAEQYVGPNSMLALAVLSGLVEAEVEAGRPEAAEPWLEQAWRRSEAHYPPGHLIRLMVSVSEARWRHRRGERAEARALLVEVSEGLNALGGGGAPLRAAVQRLEAQWSSESTR